MKKILKFIKRLFIGVLLVLYFSVAIAVSTLLLNKNDYGVTQFKDKVMILVDETIANDKYKKGELVILQTTKFEDLHVGDEVFIYGKDDDNTVRVIVSDIEELNSEAKDYRYVVLKNEGGSWGEKFIAGTTFKVYEDWGNILLFIESKWMFFLLLIVPCFFILLYEIYLIIVTVKYGDEDEEEEEVKVTKVNQQTSPEMVPLMVPGMENAQAPSYTTPVAPLPMMYQQPIEPTPMNIPNQSFVDMQTQPVIPQGEDRNNIPLKDLMMESPKEEVTPKVEDNAPLGTITPTKTYLAAPSFNFNFPPKMEEPTPSRVETIQNTNDEQIYQRYDESLDNKFIENQKELEKGTESKDAVEARLEELLKEVSKLKDELNKK